MVERKFYPVEFYQGKDRQIVDEWSTTADGKLKQTATIYPDGEEPMVQVYIDSRLVAIYTIPDTAR